MYCALAATCCAMGAGLAVPSTAAARFDMAMDTQQFYSPQADAAYESTKVAGASTVRIHVVWASVAPGGRSKPEGFDAGNPADPRYNWSAIDAAIRGANRHGLRVMADLYGAPAWAEGSDRPAPGSPAGRDVHPGAWKPNPVEFAQFAHAAALRYSGRFADPLEPGRALPRVSLWQAWIEENLPWNYAPQSFDAFRVLLNRFYDAVKGVDASNVVIVGGLAPVGFLGTSTNPLKFATELLCLRRVRSHYVAKHCRERPRFDVFAHHPYSLAATPTKHAYAYDNILVADMPKMAQALRSAERLGTVYPRGRKQFWVTEFSWFTNPPDARVGDPPATAARYAALSLYLLWRSGVSLVTWFTLQDYPGADPPGAGLFDGNGRAKLMLQAFRFPFYAQIQGRRGFAWGHAPLGGRVVVGVYRKVGRRWRLVGRTRTGSDGVFTLRFRDSRNRLFQARLPNGTASLAYDSRPVPGKRTHLLPTG